MVLDEVGVIDCLRANLRLAAESCDILATSPRKGPTYRALRDQLKLVEGASRQVAYLRLGDARWLAFGMSAEECHKRAGDWLRGIQVPGTKQRIPIAQGQLHPLFAQLAEILRAALVRADELLTKRTNRVGPILPKPGPAPHRDTRPAGWSPTPSGLLVPK
jgi:hypothetical protein